jgi:galactokinase
VTQREVIDAYLSYYGRPPEVIIKAPGRINLIGEHTDYNLGLVMPMAVDKYIYFAIGKNETNLAELHALDISDHALLDLCLLRDDHRLWVNYFIGNLLQFKKRGAALKGFNCVFGGDIPIGSGLSSSAALDCGFIYALSMLYEDPMSKWDIVEISHRSNNDFLNIKSGILDQFASVFGKLDLCMTLDCRSKEYHHYPIDLGDYQLVLINSHVKHSHSDSGYNNRPAECKEIVDIISKHEEVLSLRDIDFNMLSRHKAILTDKLYRRAHFIISENERVTAFVKAMEQKDIPQLGTLLYASHDGLSTDYEVSCSELDFLVGLSRSEEAVLGSRMMGGGFGGCTLNLLHRDYAEEVLSRIAQSYHEHTGILPEHYFVNASEGVSKI